MNHNQKEIEKIYDTVFNGQKNIITPNIITYGVSGNLLFELSWGKGLVNDKIFGVTILDPSKLEQRHPLSDSFATIKDAMEYIQGLKDRV